MSEELGVTVKRGEDFSKWYLEVVRKGNFIDQRSPIKGFDVILPWGYAVWELVQEKFNAMTKKDGVQNAYFPLVIPERLIKKEEEHFKGFEAEAAAITEAGGKRLDEKLFIRPTSETIMYYMYSIWIRSYRDLPLKINQWNNVVRWDTKVTRPFIRGREFLWQEAHTAHASEEDAMKQVRTAVEMYRQMYEYFAMDTLMLKRPKSDTFAGADFSIVFDTVMQDGKVVQGPDCHMLGQNFSKSFGIRFVDKDEKEKHVWQTSWGLSTRQIGALIMHHGDDSGAVLPPAIAPYQVVIIPILFKGKEEKVLAEAKKVCAELKGIRAYMDEREYSAGFKFNEWELRGVPLRIEIGPKDVENHQVTIVRRDNGAKSTLKLTELNRVSPILDEIQKDMLKKSQQFLKQNVRDATSAREMKSFSGFLRANWCGNEKCEDSVKESGAEIRGTLFDKEEKPFASCISCGKAAREVVYISKAY